MTVVETAVATVAEIEVFTVAATAVMTEVVTLAAASILQWHRHRLMGAKRDGREGPAGTPLQRRSLLCPCS